MAVGKNKRLGKKKGAKRKIVDPRTRKEWYSIKAPAMFKHRNAGWTLVNKTAGLKISSDSLRGRVFEANLADLNQDEDLGYRKMFLRCEEVQGSTLLTNFYGMDFTRDKLCSLVHKWRTLIECFVDVKTTDNYTLRLFCIGFTKRRPNQLRKTSYAQASQIRAIRRKMAEIMTREASKCNLKELVAKFIPETIGSEIEKACAGIFPLQNVFIRKVKTLKAPKFDLTKLLEMHEGGAEEAAGVSAEEPAVETLAGAGGRL